MALRRHKYNMKHYVFTGGRIGILTPILRQEIIPGDTWFGSISALARLKSMAEPCMHPAYLDMFFFYVPNRIVWDGWEDFITEGNGTIPTIKASPQQADFFLMGRGSDSGTDTYNNLYMRAYYLVWNEFFRDQDWQDEVPLSNGAQMNVNELKNYHTKFRKDDEQFAVEIQSEEFTVSSNKGTATIQAQDVRDRLRDLRLSERRAMFGERYFDVLRSWGIRTNYQWLDRPEYLGRARNIVSFSDIPATAAGTDVTVGDLYGHGIVGIHHRFRKRVFPEHGYLLGLAAMRFVPLMSNSTPKEALKGSQDDYWAPEYEMQSPEQLTLQNVGRSDSSTGVGYLPKFEEYRTAPNVISGNLIGPNYFSPKQVDVTDATRAAIDAIKVNPTDYDHLFNDTTAANPHFQMHVHHKLHALRQVPRVRTA